MLLHCKRDNPQIIHRVVPVSRSAYTHSLSTFILQFKKADRYPHSKTNPDKIFWWMILAAGDGQMLIF